MGNGTPRIIRKTSGMKFKAPAIILDDPKYPHNVAGALRAASCFGIGQVIFSGDRVRQEVEQARRIPREERMRGYAEVQLVNSNRPFDLFKGAGVTPVAIELRPNAEQLQNFEHPENPLYVFGPEDGSVSSSFLRLCHRFVVIPTRHCVNLSAAVYMVLYDRLLKRYQAGLEEEKPMDEILTEHRGPVLSEDNKEFVWDMLCADSN